MEAQEDPESGLGLNRNLGAVALPNAAGQGEPNPVALGEKAASAAASAGEKPIRRRCAPAGRTDLCEGQFQGGGKPVPGFFDGKDHLQIQRIFTSAGAAGASAESEIEKWVPVKGRSAEWKTA